MVGGRKDQPANPKRNTSTNRSKYPPLLKILQLCKKFPWPVKDGETLAVEALAGALAREGAAISLLAMNTSRHYFQKAAGAAWPKEMAHYREIHAVPVDNRISPAGAFLNLFSSDAYHIARFRSAAFEDALKTLLSSQTFDVCILETLYLAPYIPIIKKYSRAKIAMRAHNVEHEIWQRIAHNLKPGPKRYYLRYLVKKLRRYESEMLAHYDLLAAITERDLEIFRAMGFTGNGIILPAGLDPDHYPFADRLPEGPFSLGFIGSLDWAPNIEGLRRFLNESWPLLHPHFPDLTLEIAGRNAPAWLQGLRTPGVRVLGEVDDAKAFIRKHHLMIAPLYAGGGIRVKILEAMALGTVTLNTTLALEGIPASDRNEALIADTPEALLQQLRFAIRHPEALQAIATRARHLIETEFDRQRLAKRLIAEI